MLFPYSMPRHSLLLLGLLLLLPGLARQSSAKPPQSLPAELEAGTSRTSEPASRINPIPEKFQPLPLGAVKPQGWLRRQLEENLAGFTGHLDELVPALILRDDIYGCNRLTPSIKGKDLGAEGVPQEDQAQFLWWNSETQSNWWDGFLRTAVLLGDDQALRRAQGQVDRMLATQDKDGYLGIYDTSLRYRFHDENGELWAKATALRYLLAWYEYSHDERVRRAVVLAVDDLMAHYPAWRSHPFASLRASTSGLAHGLAITDVLEALHRMTGNPAYQDYLLFCYHDFSEQQLDEDGQLPKLRAPGTLLRGHGVHTYEQLRSVAAVCQASGTKEHREALTEFMRRIDRCTNISGGPMGDEFIAGGKADATTRGYEYCSLQELLNSYTSLLQKTGDSNFGDRVERLFHNAAQGARHPQGKGIAYLKSDNSYAMTGPLNDDPKTPNQTRYKYSPTHQDAAVCCVPNAGRIGPYFIQSMWMREGHSLVANLFGPCELRTEVRGQPVQIQEETNYPHANSLRFLITSPGTALEIKVRRPAWVDAVQANRPYREENGFLVFSLAATASPSLLELTFQTGLRQHRDQNGELSFSYGALILCHPLEARECVSKTHSVPGFEDLCYSPLNLVRYQAEEAPPTRRLGGQEVRYEALLRNSKSGRTEWVDLKPMGETILRQTSFPLDRSAANTTADFTRWVNPFSGTEGTGHTFPGPCVPFGMVQPGPDNQETGWDYTSGYQYRDNHLLGFSQTRMSGTGLPELGDILLLPQADAETRREDATYDKASEEASPGYYTVTLADGVSVELTCTERVALHRYRFPGDSARVLIDLQHGLRFQNHPLVLESDVRLDGLTGLSGYCQTDNWVRRKYFFTLIFDRKADRIVRLPDRPGDKAPRFAAEFRLGPDRLLQAKVALSSVSVDGAKANLEDGQPGWSFDETRAEARRKWNQLLSRMEIEADETTRRVFYTCLYHLCIHPSNIADSDGRYRGPDDQVKWAEGAEYYTALSTWDVYRAALPMLTIVAPERIDGIVRTLLAHHRAQGYLPIWTAWGQENHCMIGNHSIPIIAAAYSRGFRGFDANEALEAMVSTSTRPHPNSDWDILRQYGYYPFDKVPGESVSRTLETAYDDHCVASMANALGRPELARGFLERALNYRRLLDPETRLVRGRDSKGNWRSPFDPTKATSPMNNPGDYTEASAWQYTWTPGQHDINGLIDAMGGRSGFTGMLDRFFSQKVDNPDKFLGQEALIGQYPHGNEPCHHVIWLYAFSDTPWRLGQLARRVCNDFYKDSPDGLQGNDDCGQMSAWYLFATLGFYPVDPSSGKYVLGEPLVSKATILLPDGRSFVIRKACSEDTKQSPTNTLDGKKVGDTLSHEMLLRGGTLVLNPPSATPP